MTQLIQLLAANKGRPSSGASRIQVLGNDVTLYLYDTIVNDELSAQAFGGIAAQTLVPQILAITGGRIQLRINSAGGDVFAAQAIAHALRETGATVIAHIDGLAASAASVVAMAADEISMAEGAFLMIHNAWTLAIGNANDLLDTAALLEKIDRSIAVQYSQRSGMSPEAIHQLMDAETWFTAQEALAAKLVDRIASGSSSTSSTNGTNGTSLSNGTCAKADWDLSAYEHVPTQLIQAQTSALSQQHEHRERQSQRLALLNRLRFS